MASMLFKVKTIFETLPTGYYLGRPIHVELSETSADSFYNPLADTITISAPTIIETAEKSSLEGEDLEELVRGLFYHEISHAILTGKNCAEAEKDKFRANSQSHAIINIFEDERIETILKNYYMKVNFKKNLFLITGYNYEPAANDMQAFYNLVRFHVGPDKWLKRLENLLVKHANLNASSSVYDWYRYIDDVMDFYNDFAKDPNKQPDQQPQSGNGDGSGSGDGESSGSNSNGQGQGQQNGSSGAVGDGNDQAGQTKGSSNSGADDKAKGVKEINIPGTGRGLDNSIMQQALNEVTNRYVNTELIARLKKMLAVATKKKGMYSGLRRSYSGRIDPRACDREDCRYWTRVGDSDHRMYSKIHFNLFIDHSGSFSGCDDQINELLFALNSIISPDFDFDVITIDTRIVEWDNPTQYIFDANGGTNLTSKIGPIVRKHQKRGCSNFNIVVFDGEAHDPCSKKNEPFNFFDTANTVLVVDSSNERFVNHLTACKKKIINRNYANEFINEVLTLLERII